MRQLSSVGALRGLACTQAVHPSAHQQVQLQADVFLVLQQRGAYVLLTAGVLRRDVLFYGALAQTGTPE